jgi:hypothetical protein
VSTNGGATFTDKDALPASTNGDAGDPVLAYSSSAGATYFSTLSFSVSNVIQFFKSTDNGATFGAPIASATGGSFDTLDKDWLTVDNFAGTGNGNIYQTYTNFSSATSIQLTRSIDGGSTFGSPVTIASGTVQGSNVVVGTDHSVYVFWLDGNAASERILMAKSTDQGQTFGAAVTVATLRTTGVNGDLGLGFRSNAFPQAAVNPANGNIYVTFDDKAAKGKDRADVFFTQSTNGGSTWSSPSKLNDDKGHNDQWQPAIAVTPDGSHVFVTWYDRRLDRQNQLIDRFGVIGSISGSTVSFGANGRITDTSFPPVFGQDPVINSTYMGDYDQAAADNSFFYTSWGDNRLSDAAHANNPDVRFAKVSVTGIVGPQGSFIPGPSSASAKGISASSSLLSRAQTSGGSDGAAAVDHVVVQALLSTPITPAKSLLGTDSPSTGDSKPLVAARVDQFLSTPRPENQVPAIPVHQPPSPEIGDWLSATQDRLWTSVD